jgi:hypothetical protein
VPLDVVGYLLEVLTLGLIMLSGISAAWLMGARHYLLLVSLGVLASVTWRWLSYATMAALGALEADTAVWYAGSVIMVAAGAWAAARRKKFVVGAALGVGMALVAPAFTRLIGWRGVDHSDSLWILTLSDHFQASGDPTILGGRTAIKRGFSYPLMLALGPEGQSLTGFTPLVYLALMAAIAWVLIKLLPNARWWLVVTLAVLVTAVAYIPLMPWRALLYINGHTLTALGVTLAVGAGAMMVREQTLRAPHLMAVVLGLATIGTTRPEGVAFAALIAFPLISARWLGASTSRRWAIRLITASALLPFATWMWVYDAYLTRSFRFDPWEFFVLAVAISFLSGIEILDWFRERMAHFALGAIVLALLAAAALFGPALLPGLAAQWQNLGLAQGHWGFYLLAVVPLLLTVGWRNTTREYRLLAITTLMLFLATFASKLLDGGQTGNPDLGRVGWSDSLNRMWLHSFGIFLITAIVGLVQRANQGWPQKPAQQPTDSLPRPDGTQRGIT